MNWLLVMIVFGSPIKTDLIYNDIGACIAAEAETRGAWANEINTRVLWTKKNISDPDVQKRTIDYLISQSIHGTCIPSR